MTSGERMVWAAEFVRRLANDERVGQAAFGARCVVDCVRRAADAHLDDDTRAMLDDMLSTGRDR